MAQGLVDTLGDERVPLLEEISAEVILLRRNPRGVLGIAHLEQAEDLGVLLEQQVGRLRAHEDRPALHQDEEHLVVLTALVGKLPYNFFLLATDGKSVLVQPDRRGG